MCKNSSAKNCQDNKERLQTKPLKDIKVFLKKKKKKQQYGRERHKNLPEDEKKVVEYRKKDYKMRKIALL